MPTHVSYDFLTQPMSCQYSHVLQPKYAPQECQGTSAQGIDCLRGSATFRVNLKQSKPAKHQVNRSPELYFLEELWRRLQGPQGHMRESWVTSLAVTLAWDAKKNMLQKASCYKFFRRLKSILDVLS